MKDLYMISLPKAPKRPKSEPSQFETELYKKEVSMFIESIPKIVKSLNWNKLWKK